MHTGTIRSGSIGSGAKNMGYKTKVDWCDSTWNPISGCLKGCRYCYAAKQAERFGGLPPDSDCHVQEDLNRKLNGKPDPYPFGFAPTFHRYLLDVPRHWKKPRNIFVGSMADMFGDWVPDEWIREVFEACEKAPQHRYMFLTKNPKRYIQLYDNRILPERENFWYGSTATTGGVPIFWSDKHNVFCSIEPIHERFECVGLDNENKMADWLIIGAETGNSLEKISPKKEWIDEISEYASRAGIPIFMKKSVRELMGEDFKQEYPWNRC